MYQEYHRNRIVGSNIGPCAAPIGTVGAGNRQTKRGLLGSISSQYALVIHVVRRGADVIYVKNDRTILRATAQSNRRAEEKLAYHRRLVVLLLRVFVRRGSQ